MNHETMLAFLMGQRRGGGSSGGEATYWWVPFCADGVTWMGETVDNGAELAGGLFDIIELAEVKTKQYRVTVDGISYLCTDNGSGGSTYIDGNHIQIESNECPATIIAEGSFDPVVVTFADGNSHTLKVEAWIGEEPYVEGGSGESGGVGVAPQMNHGYGYLTFTTYDDEGVTAGGSRSLIEITGYDQTTISGSTSGSGYGYIYGHPEIVLHQKYVTKYGQCIQVIWNTSATDFTFKAGETYTMVFLYHT